VLLSDTLPSGGVQSCKQSCLERGCGQSGTTRLVIGSVYG